MLLFERAVGIFEAHWINLRELILTSSHLSHASCQLSTTRWSTIVPWSDNVHARALHFSGYMDWRDLCFFLLNQVQYMSFLFKSSATSMLGQWSQTASNWIWKHKLNECEWRSSVPSINVHSRPVIQKYYETKQARARPHSVPTQPTNVNWGG